MPITEVDNFTKIIKHELIVQKYSLKEEKLILYGFFFQDFLLNTTKVNFKFNLISDFILNILSKNLKFKKEELIKKNNTISLLIKKNKNTDLFQNEINEVLLNIQNNQLNKQDFWFFLIGWFLKSGSISDLKSNTYHLELKLKANELFNIFIDYFMKHKLPFKNLIRDNYCLFYIKKIDDISDFLKGLKAIDSMMKLEDKRIEKDSSNYLQRWENLDISNSLKTNLSNEHQLNLIKKIKKLNLEDELKDKEKIILNYRIKYKNSSLSQLANTINKELKQNNYVSKSNIAYFFQKWQKFLDNKK